MHLITILTRLALLVLLLIVSPGPGAIADEDAATGEPLTMQIEYWSVSKLEQRDEDGWLLAWKAKASGDLAGEMRWWFPATPPAPESTYSHGNVGYYVAKWELWNGDELILAGKSAGKTVIPDGEDGIWDGHGTILKTNEELASFVGHRIYETGIVIMPTDPEVTSSGTGMFVIF